MFSKLLFALLTIILAHAATAQTLWPQRGDFMIASRTNNTQVLGVQDGRIGQGTRIVLADLRSGLTGSVIWSYRFDNMLINKQSGLALTVHKPNSTGSVTPGTNLVQEQVNTTSTSIVQAWNYFAGTGRIHPGFAGSLCITFNGGRVTIERCVGNSPEQMWTVTALS